MPMPCVSLATSGRTEGLFVYCDLNRVIHTAPSFIGTLLRLECACDWKSVSTINTFQLPIDEISVVKELALGRQHLFGMCGGLLRNRVNLNLIKTRRPRRITQETVTN